MSELSVGTELPTVTQRATLSTSVAYAGASGDLNPLHYDQDFAAQVSPTGSIIAHGMYSMGLVSRALTQAAGGAERVREVTVRFTRPWPMGTTSTFGGTVTEIVDGVAEVALWGRAEDGETIRRGTGRIEV